MLYTLFGSVLLLVGVFTVVAGAGTADLVALTGGGGLSRQHPAGRVRAASRSAFAVKSPLWPLHTWLPDAHTEAPTVGSVILAGVLLKMGTYGLIRVGVGVAPGGRRGGPRRCSACWPSPRSSSAALVCLAQTELKRLIAYSSRSATWVSCCSASPRSPRPGCQAALIGNIAHGVITGLLFFLAGAIKDRAHTGDLAELGGLRETAPGLAGLLGFAAIASLGLPGLAGFWGEAFAVVAALERGGPLWTTLGVLAAVGGALTAAYFLRLLRRVTHGPAAPAVVGLRPARRRFELAAWAPLVLLALVLGLVPALVLAPAADPVGALSHGGAPMTSDRPRRAAAGVRRGRHRRARPPRRPAGARAAAPCSPATAARRGRDRPAAGWVRSASAPTRHASAAPAPGLLVRSPTAAAAVLAVLFAALTLGVLALSVPVLRLGAVPAGEYCFLLACSMTGGVVLGDAGDLITLIVALETLTLPLYVLVGLRRRRASTSAEARGHVLRGQRGRHRGHPARRRPALRGHRRRPPRPARRRARPADRRWSRCRWPASAWRWCWSGCAFKVAAVPLHAWAPATYDGAPLPVAAYLSTASKLGGVVALLLRRRRRAAGRRDVAGPALAVLAVLTMTVGNLVALRQSRMVRLLAWSSVAQAGYILAPLGAFALAAGRRRTRSRWRVAAVVAYAVFYVLLELAAFGAVVALRPAGGGRRRRSPTTAGAARRSPWLGRGVRAGAGRAGRPAAGPGRAVRQGGRGAGAARRRRRLARRGGGAQRGGRPGLLRAGRAPCSPATRRPAPAAVAALRRRDRRRRARSRRRSPWRWLASTIAALVVGSRRSSSLDAVGSSRPLTSVDRAGSRLPVDRSVRAFSANSQLQCPVDFTGRRARLTGWSGR